MGHLSDKVLAAAAAACLMTGAAPALAFEAPQPPELPGELYSPISVALTFRGWAGYDSNVLLVPQTPPFFPAGGVQDSPAYGLSFDGNLSYRTGPFATFSGGLKLDLSGYSSKQPMGIVADDPSAYGLMVFQPYVNAKVLLPFAVPSWVTYGYSLRRENGGGVEAIGLTSHQFTKRIDIEPAPEISLYLAGLVTLDNFDVVFPDPAYDRDGHFASLTAGGRYDLFAHGASVGLSAGISRNDANGMNWDYTGWKVGGDIAAHLVGGLHGEVSVSFEHRDYAGGFTDIVPAPGRLTEDILSVGGKLIYKIDAALSVDASASWQSITGNMPQFSSERWKVGVGVTASIQ